jgi:hypothetical protein
MKRLIVLALIIMSGIALSAPVDTNARYEKYAKQYCSGQITLAQFVLAVQDVRALELQYKLKASIERRMRGRSSMSKLSQETYDKMNGKK